MSSPESTSVPTAESPVVSQTTELVFEACETVLSDNSLTDPETIRVFDSVITSTAILAVELTLAHLREVATPEELSVLASLRHCAGI